MTRHILLAGLALVFFSVDSMARDRNVRGYVKRDGTYVNPYSRTESNDTSNDNYSTRGNQNPYTGTYGTKPRDEDSNDSYGSGNRRQKRGYGYGGYGSYGDRD